MAWTLYDFANSAFSAIVQATIFPVYYAEAIVGNADGRGDFWWGLVGSVAMIVVALTSPLLGGIADHAGVRKPFFIGFTLVSVTTTALLATLKPGMVVPGFLLAVTGLVCFEAAFVYYNSYLPRIAGPTQIGRVSAAGFAVGYVGLGAGNGNAQRDVRRVRAAHDPGTRRIRDVDHLETGSTVRDVGVRD